MLKSILFITLVTLPSWGASECWGTGFYLGIGTGADTADFARTAHVESTAHGFDVIEKTHLAAQGIFGTVFGGYGWSRSMFYVGGELNWDPRSSAAFHTSNHEFIHGAKAHTTYEINQSWGGSVLIGTLLEETALLYGRAGYSQGSFHINTTDASLANASKWLNGIRFGFGIAKRIYRNLAMRFEYNHIYYSHQSETVVDLIGSVTKTTTVKPQTNQFEFGFYYTFN